MNYRDCFRSLRRILITSYTMEIITPVVIQPMLVLLITFLIPNNVLIISLIVGLALVVSIYLAKHELRSQLLYYWIVLSITYTVIVFEMIIVSLCEIEAMENFFLLLFTIVSIFFLYLTVTSNSKPSCNGNIENGKSLMNGNGCVSTCPVCRVKMYPRNYHCNICQECIPKYDHHCYWLNCCIGEVNLHFYMAGIFFGIFALAYASLLILTTICSPEIKFGILLPEDCTDVGENIETCTCLVCGIYCMELAVVLLYKVIHHSWLISRGLLTFEWQEQCSLNLCRPSPYSAGFRNNWIHFFRKFKKIHF